MNANSGDKFGGGFERDRHSRRDNGGREGSDPSIGTDRQTTSDFGDATISGSAHHVAEILMRLPATVRVVARLEPSQPSMPPPPLLTGLSSDRNPSASRTGSRAEEQSKQERDGRMPTVTIIHCDNCGLRDHTVRNCEEPCAACGDPDHAVPRCARSFDACGCHTIPRHLYKDCKEMCELCTGKGLKHSVSECLAICHRCLSKEHNMQTCPSNRNHDRQCQSCALKGQHGVYHLATACVLNWCPDPTCDDRFHCVDHCKTCGWTTVDINELEAKGLAHRRSCYNAYAAKIISSPTVSWLIHEGL
ncbi:hypothetical protein GGR55DRAFT_661038 [Xylaria sp. FL0064]|nr:hypothetical protein GGR55DRAFT_661038 [Xylaria sp. FL0064]